MLSVRSIVVSFGGIKNEKEPRETEENVKERKNDRFSKSQTSTQRRVASRRVDAKLMSRASHEGSTTSIRANSIAVSSG